MIKKVSAFIQRLLSKSPLVVRLIILIRNQCNMVIQNHLGNYDPTANGENLIIDFVSASCFNIIDVGANKGDWTGYFIQNNPEVNALLFEPSLNAYDYLVDNYGLNPNVTIINKAVSDTEGETYFFEEPDMGERSSLISSFSNSNAKKTLVEITTIDAAVALHHISKIDFLKIDVEGYDYHVLRGATKNLALKRIQYLQFEYNAPWAEAGSTLISSLNFLKQHGYETFLIKEFGLYKFNYSKYGEYFRYSNFLATPIENIDAIKHLVLGTI